MFENLDNKQSANNSSDQSRAKNTDGSSSAEESRSGKAGQASKNVDNTVNKESASLGSGNNVEDIFEGVNTGEPVSKKNNPQKEKKVSPTVPGLLNKGIVKLFIFITLAAIVILGGAFWISEWMVNSL